MQPISGRCGEDGPYRFVPELVQSPQRIEGTIHFSPEAQSINSDYPAFTEVLDENWETGEIKIALTDNDTTADSIEITTDDEHYHIPLLSAPAYYAVTQVLDSDIDGALTTIQRHYDSRWSWEFRNNCRDTLSFEAYVEIFNSLSGHSDEFRYTQFRSGIGYFAKRIKDTGPQGISSFETLKSRVSRWNESENLKSVSIPEVIGEKLGRNWYRSGLESERTDLLDIGFQPEDFDSEWESVAPACWIAHLVLSEGIEEAANYVRDRPVTGSGSYEELKENASNADKNAGSAWGSVVSRTLQQDTPDFRFDAFNYLKHTADGYRGKAKFQPLLYDGAKRLMPEYLPDHVKQEIEFRREISIGHNWRRDTEFTLEKEAFEKAKQIARGNSKSEYDFNAFLFVDAEKSLAHVTAKSCSDEERSIKIYESAINHIQRIGDSHDVPDWRIQNMTDFLRNQLSKITS